MGKWGRQARIDAPGALHHIIVRGIERRKIFYDDLDQDSFLERLGFVLTETSTPCFAWALIQNHLHLLLRTDATPLATMMRRLLTGYAVSFNRRHRRHGQLFQNRYKSIARRHYRNFVKKGIVNGPRSDLVGGGLIRSAGGWSEVKSLRKRVARIKGDERILERRFC